MVRIVRTGLVLVLESAIILCAGCGSGGGSVSPAAGAELARENSLTSVGALLRARKENAGKSPTSSADLAKYEVGFPVGFQKVKNGEIVLLFGAPIDETAADKIVAFEKQTPESGGYVLMQDAKTVRKLSPGEFKVAPKAPGKAGVSPS